MRKIVYLTIDDCPTKDFKEKIDFLISHHIPAILFCIGQDLQQFPAEIKYALTQGYIIGNHAWSHKSFSDLSIEECKEEIKRTDDLINALHASLHMERQFFLFRFPFMDKGGYNNNSEFNQQWLSPYTQPEKKNTIQAYLRSLGYRQPLFSGIHQPWYLEHKLHEDADIFLTFDQKEYYLDTKDAPHGLEQETAILARIEEDRPLQRRSLNRNDWADIILIHDHIHTTELFYKIIRRYIDKGFSFQLPVVK